MPLTADEYLARGCGRCQYADTPDCKVHNWNEILVQLRDIILSTGLKETIKWGVPVYTHNEKIIVNLSALKEYTALGFFKGSLLTDPKNILVKQGENSSEGRLLKFTQLIEVEELRDDIIAYLFEAIDIEKSGKKIEPRTETDPIPEELQAYFNQDTEFKEAFYRLTLGRQRGYLIHFNQPKKSETRISRIEKYVPKILQGVGFHD